ncbi:MAG: hypothetical protein R6V85_02190 [Polyangia bacterium]
MTERMGLLVVALSVVVPVGCGPTCPEIKAGLDDEQLMAGDVARVNELVERRRSAVEEAERGDHDSFAMRRLEFSVTAWEMAIETQVRIIKASPRYENLDVYQEQRELIDGIRCRLDELLASGKHLVKDAMGREVQRGHDAIAKLFKRECEVPGSELKTYYDEGIQQE